MFYVIRPVVISSKGVFVQIKIFTAENGSALSHGIEITAEALWNYLSSHTNWQTLLGWIRSIALKIDTSCDDPSLHVGEKFAVCGGDVVLPSLPCCIFSQDLVGSCHKVVKEMILEELTRLVYSHHSLSWIVSFCKVLKMLGKDGPAIKSYLVKAFCHMFHRAHLLLACK